jgi:outer membrane lipoprotein-sorting protein
MIRLPRSRALRWSVPALLAGGVAVAATGVITAGASPPLPPRTAAQLLADLQRADVPGMSGTVVQNADLGLPEIPSNGPGSSPSGSTAAQLTGLLAGSHTLRLWVSGPDKERVALLSNLGETDVIHNGRDVWLWDSSSNKATHVVLPPGETGARRRGQELPAQVGLTPDQAAARALAAIDPTTAVSTDGTASVAGRAAYELVLRPKDTRSMVGQIRLAIDARTHIPLRVQVFGRTAGAKPGLEVGFTRISFDQPGAEHFVFHQPPGGTTDTHVLAGGGDLSGTVLGLPDRAEAHAAGAKVVGTGWTAVVVQDGVFIGGGGTDSGPLGPLAQRLPRVSGSWGTGRLLTGKLFSALFTDDGRVLAGAVSPDLLYAAAAR